jgi:hypothetical protein
VSVQNLVTLELKFGHSGACDLGSLFGGYLEMFFSFEVRWFYRISLIEALFWQQAYVVLAYVGAALPGPKSRYKEEGCVRRG